MMMVPPETKNNRKGEHAKGARPSIPKESISLTIKEIIQRHSLPNEEVLDFSGTEQVDFSELKEFAKIEKKSEFSSILKKSSKEESKKDKRLKKGNKEAKERETESYKKPNTESEACLMDFPPKVKNYKKKIGKAKIESLKKLRIMKSKYENMFLISADRKVDKWTIEVQGEAGIVYTITISRELTCTCPDYNKKKRVCKHIFFVVTQVAHNDQLLKNFHRLTTIAAKSYQTLDKQLQERIWVILRDNVQDSGEDEKEEEKKQDENDKLKEHPEEIPKEAHTHLDCKTCMKFFHNFCLQQFKHTKAKNLSCLLCKGHLDKEPDNKEIFSKMKSVHI